MFYNINIIAEREAVFLEDVTKDDVMSFYKKYVKIDAPSRAKLAVYVLGKSLKDCKSFFILLYLMFKKINYKSY